MIESLKISFNTSSGTNEYQIKIPSIGDFYDIEVSKQILGKGFYTNIVKTNTFGAQNAADMIDIEAHLSVLIPDFIKDLKVKNFKDLGINDYNNIRQAYIDQFVPWWNKIHDSLKIDEDALEKL